MASGCELYGAVPGYVKGTAEEAYAVGDVAGVEPGWRTWADS